MASVSQHVTRRHENERIAASAPLADAHGLIEFGCECANADCQRSVRAPLYVYRRIVEARNQCLVHTGHHAFPSYRTIVSSGLTSIEERF